MGREAFLAGMGVGLLRMLFATLRVRIDDQCGLTKTSPDFPLIFTFWHNRILAITTLFQRKYPRVRRGVVVLTSPSRDGELLARAVHGFGMGSVRGSSSRRGSQALRECRRILENGGDMAITPDGPRGPRYCLGPGLILLAQQTEARIVPLHVRYGGHWQMPTWDGFCIPFPFSRIDITVGAYEKIGPTENDEAFETERARIEKLLKDGTH